MRGSRLALYFLGIAAALTGTLALVAALMRPPLADLVQLAVSFAATALASAAIGYVSHRLGWWRRLPRLSQALTLGYLLAVGLTLLNVWLSARLMFLNLHDLTLAGLLLLFAGGISISFGYFLSHSITRAVDELMLGAERLSRGDFSVRIPQIGQDEVSRLAQAFNAMAARLQRADEETRRLDSARRDFVAWASHDLRTPLASLLAMIDALADDVVSDPETVKRYLRQCEAEISRMSTLIDALLELTQLDSGSFSLTREPSSLSDLVSDTLEGLSARAQAKSVELEGAVDPRIDPILLAPREISRVLNNLVENALRHTPAGGKVRLVGALEDGGVTVSVNDSGEGISAEDLPHVFERFYRGEKSRTRQGFGEGGMGLGLAIAKGFVEAHGGEIWVESELGRGTQMMFRLPRGGEALTLRAKG